MSTLISLKVFLSHKVYFLFRVTLVRFFSVVGIYFSVVITLVASTLNRSLSVISTRICDEVS